MQWDYTIVKLTKRQRQIWNQRPLKRARPPWRFRCRFFVHKKIDETWRLYNNAGDPLIPPLGQPKPKPRGEQIPTQNDQNYCRWLPQKKLTNTKRWDRKKIENYEINLQQQWICVLLIIIRNLNFSYQVLDFWNLANLTRIQCPAHQ